MPLDSTISATKVEIEQIQDSIEEMLSKKVSFKKAYDIKIIAGETEYEPTEFDTNVKVTISGLEKSMRITKNIKWFISKILHKIQIKQQ